MRVDSSSDASFLAASQLSAMLQTAPFPAKLVDDVAGLPRLPAERSLRVLGCSHLADESHEDRRELFRVVHHRKVTGVELDPAAAKAQGVAGLQRRRELAVAVRMT